MGFTEDYLKLRNKRQKEKEKETDEEVQKVISTGPFKSFKMQAAERGDIAPVTRQFSQAAGKNRVTDWNRKEEEEEEERTWFDSGAFDDGYQFGDVTKTILGSGVDLLENIGSGIMGMGEAAVDAFAAISPYVMQSQMSQAPVFDEKLRQKQESLVQEAIGETEEFVAKDLYDEREVAKAIITNPFRDLTGIDAEQDSVFGEKSDSLVQSAGQLAATFGLQMAGVPWFVTTGVTSFGSEAENALQQGASLAEANASGFISAGAEVLSEKLFGGDIFVKGAGADMATTFLSTAISNKTWRTLAKFGMDMAGEGVEEVFSQFVSNLGSSLYKEKDLGEILFDEEALDGYIESFVGGSVLGGGMSGINVVKSNKAGVDYVTELTKNEQAVVDKVYQDRVAEAEKNGKISQKERGKIYNEVLNEMEKGYISTDTIEEVLGGEEYANYTQTKQTEEALRQEYDTWNQEYEKLYDMPGIEKSSRQTDREAELKNLLEQRKKLLDSSPLENMRTRMGESVFSIVSGEMKGQGSRLMESYNERARRGQAYEADLSKYDQKQQAVIQKAIDSGILNNTNRTHEFVDMVAKISADKGVLFDFTNNEKLKNSGFAVDGKFVNGYVTKDGVTVNIQSKKALNSIVGHEITHVLEGTEFYDTLSEAVKNYAIAKEGLESFNKRLKSTEGLYKGMDAEVDKEIVADLVGDYLFTDSEFINRLSTEHRNIFQKMYDEVKYLFKVATAGSKEARELEKVKKAFEEAYRAGNNAIGKTKHSLTEVEPVQPKSGKWSRTHTTAEAMEKFPNMWNVAAEESEVRNPTQIVSTVNSYRKIYNFLQNEGFNGTILDASSGLGYGTKAGIEEYGFDVEDIEPYPDKSYNPKYQDYSALDKKYDVIISNAVLNVLPQDQRDALAVKMGELLNEGGRLFVNVRGKDVESLAKTGKNIHLGNMEWIETVKGSYQKGFTKPELVAYLQDALGDGFTVKPTNMFGAVSAVVTKDGAKYSISDSDGRQLTPGQQEYFGEHGIKDDNGNLLTLYRSADGGRTVWDGRGEGAWAQGVFLTDDRYVARAFAASRTNGDDILEVYAKAEKPFVIDAQGNNYMSIPLPEDAPEWLADSADIYDELNADQLPITAFENGYDAVIIKNVREGIGGDPATDVILRDSNQFKNADNKTPTSDPDIRYSLSDSQGRQLTNEQAEYFRDSKARDESGNLAVVYHGTRKADFTVFKRNATYFTDNKEMADSYSPNGEMYEGYVNITKPYEIDARGEKWSKIPIDAATKKFLQEYGASVFKEGGKWRTTPADIVSAIEEAIDNGDMDYDGIIIRNIDDTGSYYKDKGTHLATDYIVFNSNQFKNADNTKPTADKDIRFSLSEPVEETRDLMALHNLTAEKLLKSLKLGGMPMPSVAIARAKDGHSEFGEISLVLPRETIDPQASRNNKLYSGDAWTPTYPKVDYKLNSNVLKKIRDKISGLVPSEVREFGRLYLDSDNMEDSLNRYNGDMVEAFKDNDALKYAYLMEAGADVTLPMKEKNLSYSGSRENGAIIKVAEAIPAEEIHKALQGGYEEIQKLEPVVRKAVAEYVRETYGDDQFILDTFAPEEGLSFSDLDGYLTEARKYQRTGIEKTVDSRPARELIRDMTVQYSYEEWLKNLFSGIVEKEGIRNNKDYFTPSGNRRSFEALHYEHNLENVIKAMREKGEKGIGFGGGSIFGASTTEFSSIEEMKKSSDRLQQMSEEEYQEIKDGFSNRFFELASSLPHDKKSFMATDDAATTLTEAVAKYQTRSGIANYLRRELKGWATYSDQVVDDLIALVNDIRNMPTGYFEAKPQRAVYFDEVGVFVIPNNANVELKQELLNRGYSIAEYDPNVEGDRQRVVNQFEEYKFSLSNVGEQPRSYGTYNVYGKDVALEAPVAENAPVPETVSEMESVAPVAVSEMETTTEESSVAPVTVAENATSRNGLAEITKQARRENFRGAYTLDGKQYLGDGSFVAEFNTEDETLEQSAEFPAKRALKELDEAYERQVPGNYDLHTSDADGYVKVGDFLYDAKYVNALIQAIENPVFSLSNVRGGANALLVSGENGRALLMPVRAGDNVNITYEAQPVDVAQVTEADLFPDEGNLQAELDSLYQQKEALEGRMTEAMNSEDLDAFTQANTEYDEVMTRIEELESEISETERARADSLTDADVPPETDPLANVSAVAAEDPFAERSESAVGNRSVKAYQYENPEVRPFFQEAAYGLMDDINDSTPAERWYNDQLYYESGGEKGFGGNKRHTTADIADFKDAWGCSWDDLREAVQDIIEDHGKENNALSKRVEFLINDRLMYGYTNIRGEHIRPNQAYLDFLKEKQITEYSAEARESFFANADQYAPYEAPVAPVSEVPAAPVEDIAPVQMATETVNTDSKKGVIKGQQTYITTEDKLKRANSQPKALNIAPMYEAHTSKGGQVKGQQSLLKSSIRNESDRVAKVLTEEPAAEAKKSRWWSWLKNNVFDRGMVFEDVALKEGNRELQAKWNSTRYAEGKAQKFMTDGADGVKSLQEIRETVESSGKTKAFFDYLYHQHNVDRMTLEERFGVENKTVFGDTVTADVSKTTAEQLAKANPEFKEWSKDVYRYMNHLRKLMVDNGIISRETAYLWARMYPHYVPVGRVGHTGLNINVPLDTGRTGVNAPIKKAVGGSSDIRPLFTVMGERTIQTFKAIAKNSFGVELKNTLGTTIEQTAANLDEAIDSIDNHDELLKKGKKGKNPTFTVFENGKRVTFEITEDMYDAMKPAEGIVNETIKPLNIASNIFRGLVTEYNPTFMLTNPIKDVQDVLINSQHPLETYMAIPKALAQMASNGHYYEEYLYNGGEQNSYFDDEQKTFSVKKVPAWLDVIGNANNAIERLPRLAEYIASREAGASIDVAMLDAARVTTNFAAGGAWTKFLNRNGATFLNASMQGAVQQVRNIREAKVNGVKGWVKLATKALVAGIPAMVLNHLLWDDDEEYQEISDYVKQNYYIVGKYDDGKFIRIPKGRTVAVIQNAFEQMANLITGDDAVDLGTFLELAISNLAPNNPLDNNIFAPIAQVAGNRTWYGEDLIPTRLQDLPAAEQYDESTDEFSKWLGGLLNYSPYKINYLLNQYGGGLADTVLPMLTPEAESGDSSFLGTITAPFRDKFTADSVLNNQNVTEFYDLKDELTINANSSYATDEDMLKSKYMNSINSEISELYKEKREIQNSDLTDEEKYAQVRDIQQQIVDLMKEGMGSYEDITYEDEYRAGGEYARVGNRVYKRSEDGGWEKLSDDQLTKYEVTKAAGDAAYASDGENHYRWYEKDGEGEWRKITEDQLEKQEKVTSGLRISPEEYWENKEEYDYAYESPENYAIAKSVGGYEAYQTYSSEMYDIKADKDENGKSISGSRKEKVWDYISGLDISDGEKYILFKNEYNADDTYNYEIIDYLNENDDISYEDMVTILKKLGFTVDSQGNISWD